MPHRLAFVITELDVGGAERCLTNLATQLDPRRFAPVVYALAPRPTGKQLLLVEQLASASIPVHFLDGRSIRNAWTVQRRLRDLLAQQQPDLVQTFLFH